MKRFVKSIGNILAVLSIIFVIYTLVNMDIDFTTIKNWEIIIIIAALGCIISMGWVLAMGYAWVKTIQFFSIKKCNIMNAISIYAKANLGKYIPGNVMHYIERNLFAAEMGLGHLDSAVSTIVEVLGMVLATAILSTLFSWRKLMFVFGELLKSKVFIILFLIVFVFLAIILLNKNKKIHYLLLKMKTFKFWKTFFTNLLIYIVSFLVLGGILILLVQCMNSFKLSVANVVLIMTAYFIAYLVGYIVPGAPGGIGIRELVLSMILAGTGLENTVLLAAIIHRVITILGDVLGYVWSIWYIKMKTNCIH